MRYFIVSYLQTLRDRQSSGTFPVITTGEYPSLRNLRNRRGLYSNAINIVTISEVKGIRDLEQFFETKVVNGANYPLPIKDLDGP